MQIRTFAVWYRARSKILQQKAFRAPSLATNDRARLSMGLTVIKRDGREEPVAFDKITARINKLAYGLNQDHCDPVRPSVLQISRMPPDSKKPALFPRLARPPLTPRDAPRRTSRAAPTSRILPRNDPPGPRDTTPERVADRPKTASLSTCLASHLVFPSVGTRGAESRLWSLQGRHHQRAG